MTTNTILHVGEDFCQRIPVMETAGLIVLQSEMSTPAIHSVFGRGETFSAVVFHSDIVAPPEPTVHETRTLCEAPLVLFQNPAVVCEETDFNLVIPSLTPPAIWLQKLLEVIEASRELRDSSAQLRQDCSAIRSQSMRLRVESARKRKCPIDPEAIWNGENGGSADGEAPEIAHPEDASAKST